MRSGKTQRKHRSLLTAAAALVICAALFLSSCSKPYENSCSLSGELSFDISNLDEVVGMVRSALKGRSRSFSVSFSLKGEYMEDISRLVRELMDLAVEPTGVPDEGDYLKYQMGGYEYSYGHEQAGRSYKYTITVTPDYYSSLQQEILTTQKTEEILAGLSLPEDAGEADRILAVYEYISENVTYDVVHKKNDLYTQKSTAYGALVNGSAGCQGYAVAMYRLLLELGVECHIITGEGISPSGSEYHAWNLVRIGDKYYYIDPTWNYLVKEEDYCLRGSKDFPDHIPDVSFDGLYDISEYGYSKRLAKEVMSLEERFTDRPRDEWVR